MSREELAQHQDERTLTLALVAEPGRVTVLVLLAGQHRQVREFLVPRDHLVDVLYMQRQVRPRGLRGPKLMLGLAGAHA